MKQLTKPITLDQLFADSRQAMGDPLFAAEVARGFRLRSTFRLASFHALSLLCGFIVGWFVFSHNVGSIPESHYQSAQSIQMQRHTVQRPAIQFLNSAIKDDTLIARIAVSTGTLVTLILHDITGAHSVQWTFSSTSDTQEVLHALPVQLPEGQFYLEATASGLEPAICSVLKEYGPLWQFTTGRAKNPHTLPGEVHQVYGASYEVADSSEIGRFLKGPHAAELLSLLSAVPEDTNNRGIHNVFITSGGHGFFDHSDRHFFLTLWDRPVDSTFLVHQKFVVGPRKQILTIGSWQDLHLRVLCHRSH